MKVYVTRKIPESGIKLLKDRGHEVQVSEKDGVLTEEELLSALSEKPYDAVLSLLTDKIDTKAFDAAPNAKIFANYAVGYNNIDIEEANKRGITVTNTPGILTNTVAEHTIALMLSITSRIAEGDRFTRAGKYDGWAPLLLLGTDLKDKTLGILGAGRIGQRVAHIASRGLGMKLCYYDVKQNREFESEYGAKFEVSVDSVLKVADVVTVHVPLLDSTKHLINKERLEMMKESAYLINSSRGPVIDESALVEVLRENKIKGAALDVFEDEPKLAEGLPECENVVITPHIASATEETRGKMSEMAAQNIIDFLEGKTPENKVV
ncbi:MAG: D-glycerate dehydrogenase [Candidatus Pacebacteria bacterium]|jgi:lactate dehydrogenase-like 2-hydroxyacid dehydrogenase|nr:D-glycerate dehydrogenase [bacterium]MDP6527571.1 D-glycerate dehydrogenase [Candidatus Paceibacterota bacterium]MDP6659833.1 D-glycerate dehydrogenase [Candidatus Paceibacterota bacterium]|tara:strand:- start:40894 stop:41859 length:966 start_codon:yes stop_codon:yes gene_type:complete